MNIALMRAVVIGAALLSWTLLLIPFNELLAKKAGDTQDTTNGADTQDTTNGADTQDTTKGGDTQDTTKGGDTKGADIAKIVFTDFGKTKPVHTGRAGDVCGDGSGRFTTIAGGIKWKTGESVPYSIDSSSSGIDSGKAKDAVIAAFDTIDDEDHPPGQFFTQSSSNPKITVDWKSLDGKGSALARATVFYNTATKEIQKAEIVFDSDEKWTDNSSNYPCFGGGDSFNIQNVATHEILHAVGLGHVGDTLLTMYRYAATGETLKSSLGKGDQRGLDKNY